MQWGDQEREPELGDIAVQTPVECERWYRVVGIEEHRDSPKVWWLWLERVEVETWPEPNVPEKLWTFERL